MPIGAQSHRGYSVHIGGNRCSHVLIGGSWSLQMLRGAHR